MKLKKVLDGIIINKTSLGYSFKLSIQDVNFLRRGKSALDSGMMEVKGFLGITEWTLVINGLTDNYQLTIYRLGSDILIYQLTPREVSDIIGEEQTEQRRIA